LEKIIETSLFPYFVYFSRAKPGLAAKQKAGSWNVAFLLFLTTLLFYSFSSSYTFGFQYPRRSLKGQRGVKV